jgi:nucleoside 2-deoxyribosyltransferase
MRAFTGEIDPAWQQWTPQQYREALQHPSAQAGYALDMAALTACDACVLVLPSGRSASYEFGWAIGAGKRGVIVMFEACEPELMYRESPIVTTREELMAWARCASSEGCATVAPAN